MSLPPSVSPPIFAYVSTLLPLLHPLHPYLFPPCPTFTIIISAGRLLPLDSIFNVSCALISTQTLLQAYEQRWGKRKFDRRWKGRHSKKDNLAKLREIGINDGNRLLLASHRGFDHGHTYSQVISYPGYSRLNIHVEILSHFIFKYWWHLLFSAYQKRWELG